MSFSSLVRNVKGDGELLRWETWLESYIRGVVIGSNLNPGLDRGGGEGC